MIIFALETSCDETSAAVLKTPDTSPSLRRRGLGGGLELLSNIVSSQIDIHRKFGGVVPEVAARHHLENILSVIDEALNSAKIKPTQINAMAVISGPGLVTSLMVGVETAKSLAFAWQKPLISVNHMYAHIAANFFTEIVFPAVCLVVSGGHTELVYLKNYFEYKKIGQTVDDAAGEAFDKVAKLLNLGYPGGPAVSAEAEKFLTLKISPPCFKEGIKGRSKNLRPHPNPPLETRGGGCSIIFPRPMIKSDDFNFSFSGLKTAVLYAVKKMEAKEVKKRVPEICFEFQEAVVEVLTAKTIRAAKKFGAKTVMLSGGVAANRRLREKLEEAARRGGFEFSVPEFKLCTDNAAMAAIAGYYLSLKSKPRLDEWKRVKADPNWELT